MPLRVPPDAEEEPGLRQERRQHPAQRLLRVLQRHAQVRTGAEEFKIMKEEQEGFCNSNTYCTSVCVTDSSLFLERY